MHFYYILNKNLELKNNTITISKGENIENILHDNILNLTNFNIIFIKIFIKINNLINKNFYHYGDFNIQNETTLIDFLNIISKPSNILSKITIIEGWSKKELDLELSKYFTDFYSIPYHNIIADTYFFQKNTSFASFIKELEAVKKNYFIKHKNNNLFIKYSEDELMIIGSLLEKEGLDTEDKKQISSVIFNRLNMNMKLQIDATVLYAITNGNYDLERKLLISDLKIDHPFNTYLNKGLPPEPISYVGKKTLDILFLNNKNDFLFYFFNYSLNKHIFSETYKEHIKKLNDYRKQY